MAISCRLLDHGETAVVDVRTHARAALPPRARRVEPLAIGILGQTQRTTDRLLQGVAGAIGRTSREGV